MVYQDAPGRRYSNAILELDCGCPPLARRPSAANPGGCCWHWSFQDRDCCRIKLLRCEVQYIHRSVRVFLIKAKERLRVPVVNYAKPDLEQDPITQKFETARLRPDPGTQAARDCRFGRHVTASQGTDGRRRTPDVYGSPVHLDRR
jgi:hypothetical protein